MAYTTLISPEDLARHKRPIVEQGFSPADKWQPQFCVVDCRFSLDDTSAGDRDYKTQHIPGAVYAHLDRDLSGPKNGRNGRHPLPSVAAAVHTFSLMGIDTDVQVVAYGAHTDMFPARLWWLLRWLGHDAVAVLDGGLARWIEEGYPTVAGDEHRPPRHFIARPRPEMIVDADQVARLAQARDWRLVDARARERYRGDSEPIDAAAGHIPGATDHFFKENLDASGRLLGPDDLRRSFGPTIGDASPERVVCYCGSGVSACHNLLALEHAGLPGAKLYPGSWSEWSSDPERPVETGDPK